MIKNLIKNLFSRAEVLANEAEQSAKDYSDSTQQLVESGIPLTSGFSVATWGNAKLCKCGKVCVLNLFGFRSNSTISGDTKFGSLPSGEYLALANNISAGNSGVADAIVRVTPAGDLYANTMAANTYYYGQLTLFKVGG